MWEDVFDLYNCVIRKRLIYQKDKTIVNIYAPNIGTPKYLKQILADLKKEIAAIQ